MSKSRKAANGLLFVVNFDRHGYGNSEKYPEYLNLKNIFINGINK